MVGFEEIATELSSPQGGCEKNAGHMMIIRGVHDRLPQTGLQVRGRPSYPPDIPLCTNNSTSVLVISSQTTVDIAANTIPPSKLLR